MEMTDGAAAMEAAAQKVAEAVNEIIFQMIDGDDTLDCDDRKVGAFLTTGALLFANVLENVAKMGPRQAALITGMFDTLCAERLAELRERIKDV